MVRAAIANKTSEFCLESVELSVSNGRVVVAWYLSPHCVLIRWVICVDVE